MYSRELSDMSSLLMLIGENADVVAFVPTSGPFTISCAPRERGAEPKRLASSREGAASWQQLMVNLGAGE
jgi:hypothetical protein